MGSQLLLTEGEYGGGGRFGEETAEASAHNPGRQCGEQEPPQKLLGGDGHQALLAVVGIIFPAKSDLAIGNVDNPMVGDSDAMRVPGQIVEDVLRSSEWPLGVDHPVVPKQGP